jgi:hypothetical protein
VLASLQPHLLGGRDANFVQDLADHVVCLVSLIFALRRNAVSQGRGGPPAPNNNEHACLNAIGMWLKAVSVR